MATRSLFYHDDDDKVDGIDHKLTVQEFVKTSGFKIDELMLPCKALWLP